MGSGDRKKERRERADQWGPVVREREERKSEGGEGLSARVGPHKRVRLTNRVGLRNRI